MYNPYSRVCLKGLGSHCEEVADDNHALHQGLQQCGKCKATGANPSGTQTQFFFVNFGTPPNYNTNCTVHSRQRAIVVDDLHREQCQGRGRAYVSELFALIRRSNISLKTRLRWSLLSQTGQALYVLLLKQIVRGHAYVSELLELTRSSNISLDTQLRWSLFAQPG